MGAVTDVVARAVTGAVTEWFSVHLETRAPAGAVHATVEDDAADKLMDLLEDYDGVVSAGVHSWDATVSVQALSSTAAVKHGAPLIESLAAKAGLPPWLAVRVEAVRQDILDAENARPTLPELASVPEAAEILGVSQQRVRELASDGRGFPEPVYELRTGKLWLRDAIVAFGERRRRKPGRPGKGALLRERAASVLQANGMATPDIVYLDLVNDGVAENLEVKFTGLSAAHRHRVAKVVNMFHCAGLGVMAQDDDCVDEIEVYLADGHPGVIFELPAEVAGQPWTTRDPWLLGL
jgi:hypothetical protein